MEMVKVRKRTHRRSATASKQRHSPTKKLSSSPVKHLLSLVWNVLFYIFVIGIFIGALLFNFNDSPDKSFYGYRFMTVKTNSMAPNPSKPKLKGGFVAGDLIVIKQVKPESLVKHDIITFNPIKGNATAYLTHRIVEVDTPLTGDSEESLGLTTQGDANSGNDLPIQKKQVVGKVVGHVPGIGQGIQFVRDKVIVILTLIMAVFGFSLTVKYYLTIPKFEGKRRRSRR